MYGKVCSRYDYRHREGALDLLFRMTFLTDTLLNVARKVCDFSTMGIQFTVLEKQGHNLILDSLNVG